MRKIQYKFGSANGQDAQSVLAELNSPAYEGYVYYGTTTFDGQVPGAIYATGEAPAYTYELTPGPVAPGAATISAGMRGFQPMGYFVELFRPQILFGKPVGESSTYEYRGFHLESGGQNSSVEVVAALNALGAIGFCAVYGSDQPNEVLLQRRIPVTSACRYEAPEDPVDRPRYIAQLNSMGARGYKVFMAMLLDGPKLRLMYVKDASKRTSYSYYTIEADEAGLPPAPSLTAGANHWLAVLNREGAKGAEFYEPATRAAAGDSMFRIAAHCATPLCQ